MTSLRATARFQFHADFPLDAAVPLVDYYARLGVSHFYASPLTRARLGSTHGYDTIDYHVISPELGGEAALHRLVDALRGAGMGLILDIVPNHMASGPQTPWWQSVLEWGRHSPYAEYFDIDWDNADPWLRGKVLAPFLGEQFGVALAEGHLRLNFDGETGQFYVSYYETRFPLTPASFGTILRAAGEPQDEEVKTLAHFFDTLDPDMNPTQQAQVCDVLKLAAGTPVVAQAIEAALVAHDPAGQAGRTRLDALLDVQHYRLAWWRTGAEAINWRRFFEITDLAGLRVQRDDVFDDVHALVFRLYAEGWIDGVRIDHIDGLADPTAYAIKLRARMDALRDQRPGRLAEEQPIILVEKILEADERLDARWPVDGTTGYDFMDQVGALLHDPAGETPLTELWQRVSGSRERFGEHVEQARRLLIAQHFAGEVEAVARGLQRIARLRPETRDWTLVAIRRVLEELLLHVPVYRSYVDLNGRSEADSAVICRAVEAARTRLRGTDLDLLACIDGWLGGDAPRLYAADERDLRVYVAQRFQQLTSPLAAKSVEDTSFFRYGRLLSRNEVGSDPSHFSLSPAAFHKLAATRATDAPRAMLATATHDHKRGEDARMRLAVLSEMPERWGKVVESWLVRDAAVGGMPAARDAYLLYQTIVAHWEPPLSPTDATALKAYADRLTAWMSKALREAKLRSTWFDPDTAYEDGCGRFIHRLLDPAFSAAALREMQAFVDEIALAGAAKSLAQTALKLSVPGVPDIYQGTDWWDFSMMDPDNRRPVDFTARRAAEGVPATPSELWADWRSGRIKHALISKLLGVRRKRPALFAQGSYVPLTVQGAGSEDILAFTRVQGEQALVVAVALRSVPHLSGGKVDWRDVSVTLPAGFEARGFENVLDGAAVAPGAQVAVSSVAGGLPVMVLASAG